MIQASKEYKSERDEGICYTVPSLTENTYMELNVSLNQPLSKKGRDVLVSSILREIPLSIIEEDDTMESENSQENQRVNYHDLNGGSDDSSDNDDNDESFNIEDEMINPEEGTTFPYHATDIRKLIIEGEYGKLNNLIPEEVFPILFRNTFKEISAASVNRGIHFVPGRQTVDLVFLVRNTKDGNVYVLLGKRSKNKVDFPRHQSLIGGEIEEFKSPIYAALENFFKETGIKIKMLDNSLEPAIVKVENVPKCNLEQMYIVGIYSSEDELYAGTRGGSSQCFGVFIEGDITKFENVLKKSSENFDELAFCEISKALSQKLAITSSGLQLD